MWTLIRLYLPAFKSDRQKMVSVIIYLPIGDTIKMEAQKADFVLNNALYSGSIL